MFLCFLLLLLLLLFPLYLLFFVNAVDIIINSVLVSETNKSFFKSLAPEYILLPKQKHFCFFFF